MRWLAVAALCVAAICRPAAADDWGARRAPFDESVVRRYKAILATNPHDAGALRALVGMYRRHRSLDALVAEYRSRLASGDAWAPLVVLARLSQSSRTDARALWQRALKVRPDDTRGWLALGDIANNASTARDAYRNAAAHARSPRDKRTALTKLIVAAHDAGDHAAVDGAYAELIALAPKDGKLVFDRANAQLAAGWYDRAAETFDRAAALLARDPERRLTAMMGRGMAFERMGRIDDAIAQYERALDASPRGFHLRHELVQRIIGAERDRNRLADAIAWIEKRWPERSRGHFEWATLGKLYRELGDDEAALAAYTHAVRKAPTEVATQRVLILLLDKLRTPAEALAQHEAAARIAPGDAELQLALARRYHATDPDKAYATLDRLARRMSKNVSVRRKIAAQYRMWEQIERAVREYEAIAAIEPHEPDHLIVLGEVHWRVGNKQAALAAWRRLDELGTAAAQVRHADVLARHELWKQARATYTEAIARDPTLAAAWYGRARARETLGDLDGAVDDARRAVALVGDADTKTGARERNQLVRLLGRVYTEGDPNVDRIVVRWRFAFERGDIAAGYLLAAHHTSIGSPHLHEILVELYRRVPHDDELGIALARSYARREEFARAKAELARIARRAPARAEELDEFIARIESDERRVEITARWAEQDPVRRGNKARAPELVARTRFGARFMTGTDVANANGAVSGVGAYMTRRQSPSMAAVLRVDMLSRAGVMKSVSLVGASVGIVRRVLDTRKLELAAGVAVRGEIRYDEKLARGSWERAALGGDLTLELFPRAAPMSLGARFHQALTDGRRSSTLFAELGFEWR